MASEAGLARVLLEKARGDELALRTLSGVGEVPDELLGFHAQQAVEKLLKAVLARHGVAYEFRHDLEYLGELLDGAGLGRPPDFERALALTPWAVEFRYEDPPSGLAFDRSAAVELVASIRAWAERAI